MKKVLSLILATAIVLSLIPAVFASAEEPYSVTFDLTKYSGSLTGKTIYTQYKTTQPAVPVSERWAKENTDGTWSAFAYSAAAEYTSGTSDNTTNFTVMQTPGTSLTLYVGTSGEWNALMLPIEEAGVYDVTLSAPSDNYTNLNRSLMDIYIIPAPTEIPTSDDEKRDYVSEQLKDAKPVATPRYIKTNMSTSFEFEVNIPSGNSNYLFVLKNNGTDTKDNRVQILSSITFTKQTTPDAADTTAKLWAYALDGNGTVSPSGVSDAEIGVEAEVTATANAGYAFSHWQNASGDFVSADANYKFTPYSNTILYAVFKETTVSSDIGVDFYDANRAYLGFVSATEGQSFADIKASAPTPEREGYTFSGTWGLDEATLLTDETVIDKRISAVAIYDEETSENIADTIEWTTAATKSATSPAPAYGSEITPDVSDVKRWLRDGRPVAYGENYTYLAWAKTAITYSLIDVINQKPLIVLDGPSNGAYMIEYDKGNGTALEAGIIFGSSEDIKIGSCYSKAKTSQIKDHGQFVAKPAKNASDNMQDYVRGYLIYEDNVGTKRIIYTDTVKIAVAE